MERTKLSAVVKTLRKEYGLTQEDLALKSGVGLCFGAGGDVVVGQVTPAAAAIGRHLHINAA